MRANSESVTEVDVEDGDPSAPRPARMAHRHVTMMGIGGVIGAGLFIGSGPGIGTAGPGVLLAYALAGGLALCVTVALSQLVIANPKRGSFSTYAELAWGRWAGHLAGWLYWVMLAVVMALEAIASESIVHAFAPELPEWSLIPILGLAVAGCNLLATRWYGEAEFWSALVKVVAIVLFMIIGILWLFRGHAPAIPSASLADLFPTGVSGLVDALLIVVFAYGGIELVSFAAVESESPRKAMAATIRSTALRIALFYVGSILIIVMVLPWQEAASAAAGPYAAALGAMGLGDLVTGTMSAVIFFTLLSSMNSQLFGASRLLASLAERGAAPPLFAKKNKGGTPITAVLASLSVALVGTVVQLLWPEGLFGYLARAIGGVVLAVWILVGITALRSTWGISFWSVLPGAISVVAPIAVIVVYGATLGWGDLGLTACLLIVVLLLVLANDVRIRRRADKKLKTEASIG